MALVDFRGKKSVSRSTAEQSFHIAVAEYLNLALPSHTTWTTFPAGGGGQRRGQFLKAMGLRAGWPDIQILVRDTAFDSARPMVRFIGLELKAGNGVESKSQKICHSLIRNAGGIIYTVRSLEEIYDALVNKEHLRLRATPVMANVSPSPQDRAQSQRTAT